MDVVVSKVGALAEMALGAITGVFVPVGGVDGFGVGLFGDGFCEPGSGTEGIELSAVAGETRAWVRAADSAKTDAVRRSARFVFILVTVFVTVGEASRPYRFPTRP